MTRGRPKKVESNKLQQNLLKRCNNCKEEKKLDQFYLSSNPLDGDGRTAICRQCVNDNVDIEKIDSIHNMLINLNKPFLANLWQTSLEESERTGRHTWGLYLKSLYLNYKELSWKDSDFISKDKNADDNSSSISTSPQSPSSMIDISDKKNEEDVLRMLGYDPFEFETTTDRRHLFNKLVDFLDESTLEDNFKLPAVIEIVKSFNQIDKINSALSHITSDAKTLSTNVGGITSLVSAKEKMLKSVLALAKDNGISVNHNNNKSKGSGTLSGIIKQLHEKGISAAEINVYDIDTCEGMKQVADISNKSILDQLMLNENDYTEMIKDQREMILTYEQKIAQLDEENRLLKIKVKQYEE